MWELYDALIEGIPDDIVVEDMVLGGELTYVEANGGIGIAGYRYYIQRAPMMTENRIGKPLKEVAGCVKSWNFWEASIGNAAINAWYNHPETARRAGIEVAEKKRVEERLKDPFIKSQNLVKGKKVCVVGHFPFLEKLIAPVSDLSIIEWDPEEGDYPYSACEYLLPESDYVFLTCGALGDKSMPRLLELSENAESVTIVGPGTPLSSVFFDYGVSDLSGFIATDAALAKRIIRGAENQRIFGAGMKVEYLRPGV
ncbi:hypothetical protein FKB36_03060 [Methanoculleus sp. Afa-1]|uniref:DUF364 domain-containing protein n=1 Tax=Methanoculleus formosensis TaxID=2590886 RepID=A0A9E4ZJB1_9EURY|nr:DUF364 domain-containing protein [Methanoculleus sp. Afa-1]MCT8336499.1 hypothetical protein [Methanoculleus sp. Afa-1]